MFAWGCVSSQSAPTGNLPYVLEPTVTSLQLLEQLLSRCCSRIDPQSSWPPAQDVECLAVSLLNLLRLQFKWLLSNAAAQLLQADLHSSSALFQRLKSHVIVLACGCPALGAVQTVAQATLQEAWSLLLPTAQERATALASLLHRKPKMWRQSILLVTLQSVLFT